MPSSTPLYALVAASFPFSSPSSLAPPYLNRNPYCRPHPRAHSPALSSLTSPSSYPPPSPSPVRVNVNHAAITVYDRFWTQTVTAFENGPCHVDVALALKPRIEYK